MSNRRIGVYICHCGGNISDYVKVEDVREAVENDHGVVIAKTSMFTCSDATQQEIINDIKEHNLDGLVVSSCSPSLHLLTFRGAAKRANLNPYQYIQVNIREQCSWAHSDKKEEATAKAVGLVKAGIAKAKHTEPLEPIRLTSVKTVMILGAGISGLRAALEMAKLGVEVFLVEREPEVGGQVAKLGTMYPHGKSGQELINSLMEKIKAEKGVTIYTNAELVEKTGAIGSFSTKIKIKDQEELVEVTAGAIIVTTGFDSYTPEENEYGYGHKKVVTLPEFEQMIQKSDGKLIHNDQEVKSIAYIYCVGSRHPEDKEDGNYYCSRFCCNAAVHSTLQLNEKFSDIRTFHVYRDIRTYGKFELMYEKACSEGAVFLRFSEEDIPQVETNGDDVTVKVTDLLTGSEEITITPDLLVLVTGMVPCKNDKLNHTLKLPLGADRFYNEIHQKLRPVETVIDGVYIAGSCQGPKNATESITSSLSAVAKAAGLLVKGYVELQPLIALADKETCTWCGKCDQICPYMAIGKVKEGDKEIAVVNESLCKGCGACIPICPTDAMQLKGYTDAQIMSMIDAFMEEPANA